MWWSKVILKRKNYPIKTKIPLSFSLDIQLLSTSKGAFLAIVAFGFELGCSKLNKLKIVHSINLWQA